MRILERNLLYLIFKSVNGDILLIIICILICKSKVIWCFLFLFESFVKFFLKIINFIKWLKGYGYDYV